MGRRGSLPTCCGRGCAGVGAQHALSPWLACPVGAACRGGAVGGHPRGGVAFSLCEGRPTSGAVPPLAACPPERAAGVSNPCVPGAVGVGVGTQHGLHGMRPCEPSLGAVGVAEGRPQGGCLSPLCGASEFTRSPSPGCPLSGRAVGVRYSGAVGAGVQAWGTSTVPLACMPCGGCVPRGWWGPSPGGGVAFHRGEGRLLSGAVPPPAARPLGRATGVPRPVCPGCGQCGCGAPAPFPQRAPLRAVFARCGVGRRESPGGPALHRSDGRLSSGAPSPPAARPLGVLLGSATHVL